MEMVLNNGFRELELQEMESIEGGNPLTAVWPVIKTAAVKTATVVGSVCGLGPVGGAVVIAATVAVVGVGIACAKNGVE